MAYIRTMEFGIFLNGYIPGPAAHDSECEHTALMREAEYAIFADKHNWKYAWFGEHHGLTEYSHMSAPEVVMGYVAARTERIHLSSGIVSFPTVKEHPVRFAERAAMLDHITGGRYEFGTGRGAGSHEVASFNGLTTDETKSMWNEVIREIPRMWEQRDYDFVGEHFSVPTPHNILPKPYGHGHPAMWVACGNPATFAQAGSTFKPFALAAATEQDILLNSVWPGDSPATVDGSPDGFDIQRVWEAATTVYDPEIPVDIVELGLVYRVEADELPSGGWHVDIDMSVTAPFCGMGDILRQDLHDAVAAIGGVETVDVKLVFDPPWDVSRLSDVARLELGMM